jgi:16S rRNA (cytosine1402-N4)-methyltransferase
MYHNPALLTESLEALNIKKSGTYVDVTFGGGGHSKDILNRLGKDGMLVAFDRDEDAQANIPKKDDRFLLIPHNYAFIKHYLQYLNKPSVNGILADLGISSWQVDQEDRGFSFRFEDSVLDMRMDKNTSITAADVLNTYSEVKLVKLFSEYGEVKNSKTLAREICRQRQIAPFKLTQEFVLLADKIVPRGDTLKKYLAPIFQALRIEVNKELESLKSFLSNAEKCLSPGGRLAIITYHSLEDRIVKQFFATGNVDGIENKDFFGRSFGPFKIINKKPITPTEEEIFKNPRVRSAKLRIVEKIIS